VSPERRYPLGLDRAEETGLAAGSLEVVMLRHVLAHNGGRYVVRELSSGLRSPAWAAREAMVTAGSATAEDLRRWNRAFEATVGRPATFFAPMFTAIGRLRPNLSKPSLD
jgi:hypothetical protein